MKSLGEMVLFETSLAWPHHSDYADMLPLRHIQETQAHQARQTPSVAEEVTVGAASREVAVARVAAGVLQCH